jgi:hypothetical protein
VAELGTGGLRDRGSRGTFNPTLACAAWPCVRRGVAASTGVRRGRHAVVARSPSVAGVGSREGDERMKDPASGVEVIRDPEVVGPGRSIRHPPVSLCKTEQLRHFNDCGKNVYVMSYGC